MDDYEPTSPQLQRVKSSLSAASWRRRVEEACADEVVIKQVLAEVSRGTSLNQVMERLLPASRRSWALRRIPGYRKEGFEALIDSRTPREPTVSRGCRQALQAARAANPQVTKTEALEILKAQKVKPLPSEATIKREFARVDGRRKYADKKKRAAHEVVELPFAGGELLLAAEVETGGITALTEAVTRLAEEAHEAAQGQTADKDVALRDRKGRFTVGYNQKRRRKRGEQIAAYLRPAADKAKGRVPTWPRFVHEQQKTIDAKLRMLTFGWLVAGSKGWAALRAPEAAGLESLTGFAYMPSTLSKLVSALSISGAGEPLLATVGQHWHGVAQAHFGEPGAMAAGDGEGRRNRDRQLALLPALLVVHAYHQSLQQQKMKKKDQEPAAPPSRSRAAGARQDQAQARRRADMFRLFAAWEARRLQELEEHGPGRPPAACSYLGDSPDHESEEESLAHGN